jgi:hypothetical protein
LILIDPPRVRVVTVVTVFEEVSTLLAFLAKFRLSRGVIPKCPRFYERAEGSPVARFIVREILRSA